MQQLSWAAEVLTLSTPWAWKLVFTWDGLLCT